MKRLLTPLLLSVIAFGQSNAPNWDSSGNGMLTGAYFVRMLSFLMRADGSISEARAVIGTIAFDGNGAFTLNGQRLDATSGQLSPLTFTGTYGVSPNGMAYLQNPLFGGQSSETIGAAVGKGGLLAGSSTEGVHNDLILGIPINASAQASSFTGRFWVGALDFPQANTQRVRNSLFQIESNGQGGLGAVAVTGRDAAKQNAEATQNSPGATYAFGTGGAGTMTIPLPTGVLEADALFSGTKTFYLSSDGNYILGGTPGGFDIFFGMRPFAGTPSNQAFNGPYHTAGLDIDFLDAASPYLDSFYGSANALGTGKGLWHLRLVPFNSSAYDFTYDSDLTIGADGTATEGIFKYVLGAGGDALLVVGRDVGYTLQPVFKMPASSPGSGPYISPGGVLNAASYSPITNSVAGGEFITLFGQNLAGSAASASVPFPTALGGVQVMINGRAAPLSLVSPTQINAMVPYATENESLVRVQVIRDGANSNTVTVYQGSCAPGVFTVPPVGSGFGAILHPDYSLVDQNNPAVPGEVVQIYLTGLGAVSPAVADGAAAPSAEPLARTIKTYDVYIDGILGTVEYSGLAPGFAGLYQLNVRIPSDVQSASSYITVSSDGCVAQQAQIPIRK